MAQLLNTTIDGTLQVNSTATIDGGLTIANKITLQDDSYPKLYCNDREIMNMDYNGELSIGYGVNQNSKKTKIYGTPVEVIGNLEVSGGVTVDGHNSAIGSVLSGSVIRASGYAMTAGTYTTVASITLPVGVWNVTGFVRIGASTSATYKIIGLSTSTSGFNANYCQTWYAGTSYFYGACPTDIFTVSSGTSVVYLAAQSGAACKTQDAPRIKAVRIA